MFYETLLYKADDLQSVSMLVVTTLILTFDGKNWVTSIAFFYQVHQHFAAKSVPDRQCELLHTSDFNGKRF